jgi:hypothetical protein
MSPSVDDVWCHIYQDNVLEIRDPNSGVGADPVTKPRHQYKLLDDWLVVHRVLPPTSVGERWADDDCDAPWWEPMLDLPGGPVLDWWLSCSDAYEWMRMAVAESGFRRWTYDLCARAAAGHVVAYTPAGREVRWCPDGGVEYQPHNETYWLRATDLRDARREYCAVQDRPRNMGITPTEAIDTLGWTMEHILYCALGFTPSWMRGWREEAERVGIDPDKLRSWCREQMAAEGVLGEETP